MIESNKKTYKKQKRSLRNTDIELRDSDTKRKRENRDNFEYRDNTDRANGIHEEVREQREKNNQR